LRAALQSYFESLGWLIATVATIFGRKRGAFSAAAFLLGVLRVMQFLAMVLPLKVVLLAGGSGVPDYMPFISPGDKMIWIAGLAVGSIVAFVLSQFLDSIVRRLCETAGNRLMEEAADLAVVPNQKDQARSIFHDMASVIADLSFWAVGMLVYLLLAPLTFLAFAAVTLASFVLGTIFATAGNRWDLGRIHRFVLDRTNVYLSINNSVIFFTIFLVILVPFFAGWPVNLLVALISIILLRRSLTALFGAVKDSLRLLGKRHVIEALMFREKQFVPRENAERQTLTAMFTRDRRRNLVADMLKQAGETAAIDSVNWVDPVVGGVWLFDIPCADGRHFQLQVFPASRSQAVMNEDMLFANLDREQVGAPRLIADARHGEFRCRLLQAGEGVSPVGSEWREARARVLGKLLGVRPGKALVDIYCSTHLLLHQKLEDEFVERVRIAVKNPEERKAFKSFVGDLATLREKLESMPLYVDNPTSTRTGMLANGDGSPLVFHWWQWGLKPLGAGAASKLEAEQLDNVLETLRRTRSDIPDWLTAKDLAEAGIADAIVGHIEKGAYRAALESIMEMQRLLEQAHRQAAE